jgi:hypothetical protein
LPGVGRRYEKSPLVIWSRLALLWTPPNCDVMLLVAAPPADTGNLLPLVIGPATIIGWTGSDYEPTECYFAPLASACEFFGEFIHLFVVSRAAPQPLWAEHYLANVTMGAVTRRSYHPWSDQIRLGYWRSIVLAKRLRVNGLKRCLESERQDASAKIKRRG